VLPQIIVALAVAGPWADSRNAMGRRIVLMIGFSMLPPALRGVSRRLKNPTVLVAAQIFDGIAGASFRDHGGR